MEKENKKNIYSGNILSLYNSFLNFFSIKDYVVGKDPAMADSILLDKFKTMTSEEINLLLSRKETEASEIKNKNTYLKFLKRLNHVANSKANTKEKKSTVLKSLLEKTEDRLKTIKPEMTDIAKIESEAKERERARFFKMLTSGLVRLINLKGSR